MSVTGRVRAHGPEAASGGSPAPGRLACARPQRADRQAFWMANSLSERPHAPPVRMSPVDPPGDRTLRVVPGVWHAPAHHIPTGRAKLQEGRHVISLLLGFGAVSLGAASVLRRGRSAGALLLGAAGALGLVAAVVAAGREGLHDLALGALLGLPVLIGCIIKRDRAQGSSSPA